MVNWKDKDIEAWRASAVEEQSKFCNMLGDRRWDRIEPNEQIVLRRKVAYGLFGLPTRVPNEKDSQDIGYTEDEMNQVTAICDAIKTMGEEHGHRGVTWFACIFVSCKMFEKRFTIPVFRILKDYASDHYSLSNCIFIDSNCRVYSSWDDYLSNNTLPTCLVIYPKDGIYQTNEDGDFMGMKNRSAACWPSNRTVSFLDKAAAVASISASAVGLAALCTVPVAGPIAATAIGTGMVTGGYAAIRSTAALIDRYEHKQSIGLGDWESRNCWLGIISAPLSFTQMGMLVYMRNSAKAGDIMCKAARVTYSIVNIACLSTSGLGIFNGFVTVIKKSNDGTLTPLDVYQLTASCVFFTHSLMNTHRASTIIKEAQQNHIDAYKEYLGNDETKRADFDSVVEKMQGQRKMHNSARLIKGLKNVNNMDEFINSLVDVERMHDFQDTKMNIDDGLINLQEEWLIHPKRLTQIDVDTAKTLVQSAKELQANDINLQKFKGNLAKICRDYRIRSESMRAETITKLQEHFGVQSLDKCEVNGVKIFEDLPGPVIDRLTQVMENTAKNYKSEIIEIAMEFASREKCQNPRDFCSYLEYSAKYMNDKRREYIDDYKKNPGNYEKFTEKETVHFEKCVYQDFMAGNKESRFAEMSKQFNETKANVAQANATGDPKFNSNISATYHYEKHKAKFSTNGNEITPAEYINIARDLASGEPNARVLSQEGTVTFLTYTDSTGNAKVVAVQPESDGNAAIHLATLM